ncbi:MAG: carbohydrate-binding family 9-like protein [Phycisphaerae bacterium]|nr:carbohydrate-binding family 9-like protein [Phycisphaerae bacterium]
MNQPKNYLVRRASGPVRLACDATAWEQAYRLAIDEYPWYTGGFKQETTAAVLYDDEAIYLLFVCADKHISAVETDTNSNVHIDSCVEFFATIDPDGHWGKWGYFNFEANCCGTAKLGFRPGPEWRTLAPAELVETIGVSTSIPTPTKTESPDDDGWWLAAAIPFSVISEIAGRKVAPKSGAQWRVNFYRCGGKTDPQAACWNPIDLPEQDYHRPEFFGNMSFE